MTRRVLLWDVMGTLVHDPFFKEMPEFFGMSFQAMLGAKHPSAWVEFELGLRTEDQFLSDFFVDRRAFDHRGFVETIRDAYRWLPGMSELMTELRAHGWEMHAFSNYPVWYELIEERLGLSRYLDWTFVSCLIGVRKPDAAAYTRVIGEFELPAEQLFFVDDRESNCDAAREAGIASTRYTGVEALRKSLAAASVL